MKKLFFSLFLLSAALLSGCLVRQAGMTGSQVSFQVTTDISKMQYLGEVTGEGEVTRVLGLFTMGGRRDQTGVILGDNPVSLEVRNTRAYRNALYDILASHPDADCVLPVSASSTVERMFLGRHIKVKVRAKLFKFKF